MATFAKKHVLQEMIVREKYKRLMRTYTTMAVREKEIRTRAEAADKKSILNKGFVIFLLVSMKE